MPLRKLFITGTDTDCGKTQVACALIRALRQQGLNTAPYKPVAAGAENINGELRHHDALQLIKATAENWHYEHVNPYCLPDPISPHLAASNMNINIELNIIQQGAKKLASEADCLIAEGAGGWLTPLSKQFDIASMVSALDLPVLLVVGMRLGCLNHARLSALAIQHAGVQTVGWVGSQVEPEMAQFENNITTLQHCLPLPYLGYLPFGADTLTPGVSGLADLFC